MPSHVPALRLLHPSRVLAIPGSYSFQAPVELSPGSWDLAASLSPCPVLMPCTCPCRAVSFHFQTLAPSQALAPSPDHFTSKAPVPPMLLSHPRLLLHPIPLPRYPLPLSGSHTFPGSCTLPSSYAFPVYCTLPGPCMVPYPCPYRAVPSWAPVPSHTQALAPSQTPAQSRLLHFPRFLYPPRPMSP